MYIGLERLFWDFFTYRLLLSDFICISLQLQYRLDCHVRDVNNYSRYAAVPGCLYSSLFLQHKKYKRISNRYALLYWHQKLLIRLCFQKSYCILLINRSITSQVTFAAALWKSCTIAQGGSGGNVSILGDDSIGHCEKKKFISTCV